MNHFFKGLILFFVITGCVDLSGQHGLSIVYAPSKVIKHRSTLLFDVPDRSHEIRLAYTFQTTGKRRWERYWNKPRITLNALYVNFGNGEVLGEAFDQTRSIGWISELLSTAGQKAASRWKVLQVPLHGALRIVLLLFVQEISEQSGKL